MKKNKRVKKGYPTRLETANHRQWQSLGSIEMCRKLLLSILVDIDICSKEWHINAIDATCFYMKQAVKNKYQNEKRRILHPPPPMKKEVI